MASTFTAAGISHEWRVIMEAALGDDWERLVGWVPSSSGSAGGGGTSWVSSTSTTTTTSSGGPKLSSSSSGASASSGSSGSLRDFPDRKARLSNAIMRCLKPGAAAPATKTIEWLPPITDIDIIRVIPMLSEAIKWDKSFRDLQGHELKLITRTQLKKETGYTNGYRCDICMSSGSNMGDPMHCSECKYDICPACVKRQQDAM
ncbi:hypothetical protein Pelo_10137 [Pelomyxa schiedti]|nr:hypothetical protein Pelo_10137 [Pelomyxa schiedti]